MQNFNDHHTHTPEGKFVVPLPKKSDGKQLGESHTQAARRFLVLECSLKFQDIDSESCEACSFTRSKRGRFQGVLPSHICSSEIIHQDMSHF